MRLDIGGWNCQHFIMTVDEIIERTGGVTALAKAVGVHHSTVCDWRRNGEVPLKRVHDVARAVGVTLHEIRPDFFPASETEGVA